MIYRFIIAALIIFSISCNSFNIDDKTSASNTADKELIRNLQKEYVSQWLKGNEEGVLSLFTQEARIQPSSLCPIDSLKNIRNFWFPKDGSHTIIDHFDIQPLNIYIDRDTAVSTGISTLDWRYEKDTVKFKVSQKGIETTVYKRQKDNSWKVWRQMWTDLYANKSN